MRTQGLIVRIVCLLALGTGAPAQQANAPKASQPNIYDETLDGSDQVAEAVAVAHEEHKRVLLQFGANGCGWCHRLHTLFETDLAIREKLKASYVVALVEVVNNRHNNQVFEAKYGPHAIPFLVVLDSEGKDLTTEDTGVLEEGDHHSPQRVLAFLEKWAPTPLTAEHAKAVAMRLANDRAFALYQCRPFRSSRPAHWEAGHWVWDAQQGIGHSDIRATVELAMDGSTNTVEVQVLDSQAVMKGASIYDLRPGGVGGWER